MKTNIIIGIIFDIIAALLFTLSIFFEDIRIIMIGIGSVLLILGSIMQISSRSK